MASTISAGTTSGTALNMAGDTSGNLALLTQNGANTISVPNATGTMMVSGNMPAFSAYASGGQNVATVTNTKIQFNVKNFDTASAYDNTTNYRFQPLVAGYYQINSVILFGGGANGFSAYSSIYKNGSQYLLSNLATPNSNSYGAGCSVSAVIYLNGSTDYVEIYAYQSSGVTLAMQAGNVNCQFSGAMIRSA